MSKEYGVYETFTARETRTVFGGDGGTLKYFPARLTSNPQRVRTLENTDDGIHSPTPGSVITGIPAFR